MYCRHCGSEIPEGASFCTNCGQAVSSPSEPKPSVPEPHSTGKRRFLPVLIVVAILLIFAIIAGMEFEGALLILALAFCVYALVIKPRILARHIKKRLVDGTAIPNHIDYSTISSMLKEEPYSDKVVIKNEGLMETESGQQIGFVEAVIKGGFQFKLKLVPTSSGTLNLILEGSSSSKWDLDGGFQVAKHYLEADELYRNILHKLLPNYVEQRVQDEREIKTTKTYRHLATAIIVVFVGYVIVTTFLPNLIRNPVNDLQDVVFEDYGTMTLGEAVDSTVENARWSSEEVDDTHYLVTLSGFQPDLYANFEATFDVNYTDDYVYASISSVEYGGETYTDIFSLAFVLSAIYGN